VKISLRFQLHFRDVRYNPFDLFREQTQPLLRHVEGSLRHIKETRGTTMQYFIFSRQLSNALLMSETSQRPSSPVGT
jgi:hypothetical protein